MSGPFDFFPIRGEELRDIFGIPDTHAVAAAVMCAALALLLQWSHPVPLGLTVVVLGAAVADDAVNARLSAWIGREVRLAVTVRDEGERPVRLRQKEELRPPRKQRSQRPTGRRC